ncbi:TPA: hypothetical protein IAA82_00985 [Candidatus Galligastranaerophilus gallistercoris]|nr:hypothetical protein [Candidatus Galligastranaerophilus gallistercoris]
MSIFENTTNLLHFIKTEASMKIYLICDESGCKGFSDKLTDTNQDIGVFAGYSIPEDKIEDFKLNINSIASKYANEDGKTHITDLSEQNQMLLRNELFNFVLSLKGFYFFYEAIHHNGFCKHHKDNELFLKEHKHENPRFKTSENHSKYRLHTTLFQSLFTKNIAFLLDLNIKEFDIHVITDKIDVPIIKEFDRSIQDFLNLESKTEYTGYDTIDKQVKRGSIEVKVEGIPDYRENLKNYCINIATEENENLVLLADVLANSILYCLNKNKENQFLNSRASLEEHPLYKCLYAPDIDGGWINDIMYRTT